ncbi:MAG: serine hydroxymethyltransferase [Candidatus Yanofskybacteria bacterium]|nr:serine hydroxymethyltransferase [Candidatus Yanofskybacteria bacterium]
MIKDLIKKEARRQKKVINLIPSENYVSKNVLAALGSPLTNKYAEGKSHQRYYFGNEVVDELEDEVKRLVLKVFKISSEEWGVNVQPYSGSIANMAAYLASVNVGDKILAMSLEHGGHLTHGHHVSWTGKLFKFEHYGVGHDGWLDYDGIAKIAKEFKPALIVCGATAYPRQLDFKKFKEISDSVGALLMADISHIAGLVVGGVHPSPFPYADIVTTTTQKTLRGPRGAIIISAKRPRPYANGGSGKTKNEKEILSDAIDKAVFPGLQGGPQVHTIAAMGVALEEAIKPSFKKYAKQIVNNAKKLSEELGRLGFKIVSGGTDNHLLLVDVTPLGLTGGEAGSKLEKAGIIVNKNMIPFDTRKPWDPSGIRLGTPAVTTQGMKEKDMVKIAEEISTILKQ